MATPVSVYVFGDQTYDISSLLSTLLQAKKDPLLNDFLERSLHALKRETKQLPPWQQTECPRYSKLADLLPYWRAGTLNPALGQAITCLCQLGLFLLDHGCAGQAYPTSDNAVATGLCTGTLSAATVASASNASTLLPIAVYTVKVAFRVGACAWDVGSRLAELRGEDGRFQQWTAALHGLGEDDVKSALERFIATKAIPPVAGPYLSAHIGPKQFSVSGPPEILNALLAEPRLSKHVLTRLFITSPYHARHLYSRNDVDRILHDVDAFWTGPPSDAIKVISTVTGQPLPSSPFPAVLRIAVEDCLQHGIRWDLATDGVAAHIHSAGAHTFTICPVAASVDRLRPAIEKANLKGVENDASPTLTMNPGHPAAKSKIAVIGSSARLPQASDLDKFWDVLVRGIDTHEVVPAKRWNSRTHVGDATHAKNVSATGFGCWLHEAGQFDARFFNMSPREAPQVDPAQRLALLTAAEALDYAGVVPGRTSSTQKDRVGVYFGSTSNDWMETNSAQNIDTYFIPGGNRAFIPGRINYHFKFSGPSYTIDTACSSSLAAIHMACNALWRGEVDTAIVGGTNVLTNPDMTAGLDRGHFLSRTGNCKTFDESADGYCRGEGVATMILKRLPDAEADKDPIQACILGIATNHSAEADSITRPHVGAQQALFESLLADVGVHPHDISYVEMHGTGTQAGDAGETASVLETLAPAHGPLARPTTRPLYIGAAKANVGHGESVAGITSLAKILLMLKHSTIPPHCGIKTKLNSKIPDLVPRNTFIAKSAVDWQKPQSTPRRVLLNNFSAAGGNTALLLEDAPNLAINSDSDPRQFHPVGLSAKTPISLEENIKSLMQWISDQKSDGASILPQLSYTTTARRNHHLHRVMVTGSDLNQIKTGLQEALDLKEGSTRPKSAPDFVFAFTGQGAHYAGMGSDLYAAFSNFRADVHRYDQLCLQLDLPSIRHLFEDLSANARATPTMLQLSAVCLQMALFRLWTSFGVTPKAVVGHSLGEYPALYAAGVLSQADVLHLVGRRAQLMEMHCQQNSHAMLAVRSSLADIKEYLGPAGTDYEVTCANGRRSSVIGGTTTQMNAVRPSLQRKGSSSTLLQVPYAFHTSQVDPILPALRALAQGTKFAQPSIPVISPACGKVVRDSADLGADYIVKHCRASVNMYEALSCAKEEGLINEQMMALEIGPSVVVSNMVKEVAGPGLRAFPTVKQGEDTWKLLSSSMTRFHTAGASLSWSEYHADFPMCQRVLELPHYRWDLKDYWIQYIHDWSLRKGDPPLRAPSTRLESSDIHTVVQDTLSSSGGELIVQADLNRPDLNPMVQGHKVYGVPLCTPSVYADIALTIGEYVRQVLEPSDPSTRIEIAEMTIQSALVANPHGEQQLLQTAVQLNQEERTARCTFSSVDADGKLIEQHAHCTIRLFDSQALLKQLQTSAPGIRSRIAALKEQVGGSGNTYRFSKSMIYKMVGQLADFDPNYRGLIEITMDNGALEACGVVSCRDVNKKGTFHTNPACIDALSQLGGFVMNANESVDLDKEVYVNHGWHGLKLFEDIEPDTTYTTHVKMSEGADKLWTGDITVFDGDKIVAMFSSVALQNVPKRLMSYIVNTANKRVSGEQGKKPLKSPSDGPVSPKSRAPKTTTKPAAPTAAPQPLNLVASAVEIIAQESGLAMSDLTDEVVFDDLGIDSLLSLVISSRLRDELELDFESSLLLELNTMGRLKSYLRDLEPAQQTTPTATETVGTNRAVSQSINAQTGSAEDASATWKSALDVISEESGLTTQDLSGDLAFADVGIDSLLSLVICSRLRDELDIDLAEGSLFMDCPTVKDLQRRITGISDGSAHSDDSSSSTSPEHSSPASPRNGTQTPDTEPENAVRVGDLAKGNMRRQDSVVSNSNAEPVRPAWSIVLQGTPKKAHRRLFLFPDGCGAATSYLRLPTVSEGTSVIGFNSPYMKHPHDMHGRRLSEILASYVAAVRKHQEHGPYHLGGWSAGGILAYAIAQELMAAGETVSNLLLIDSPAPTNGLDRLPKKFFDHCTKVGIFGSEMGESAKVPAWLMPHFEATIELLHDYCAPPMPKSNTVPKASLLWAGACAFDGVKYAHLPDLNADGEGTEGMKFLTEPRTDLGPGKWSILFPGQKLNVGVVEGEHHFSMMRDKGAEQLVQWIRKELGISSLT